MGEGGRFNEFCTFDGGERGERPGRCPGPRDILASRKVECVRTGGRQRSGRRIKLIAKLA